VYVEHDVHQRALDERELVDDALHGVLAYQLPAHIAHVVNGDARAPLAVAARQIAAQSLDCSPVHPRASPNKTDRLHALAVRYATTHIGRADDPLCAQPHGVGLDCAVVTRRRAQTRPQYGLGRAEIVGQELDVVRLGRVRRCTHSISDRAHSHVFAPCVLNVGKFFSTKSKLLAIPNLHRQLDPTRTPPNQPINMISEDRRASINV
jgi:hypothetical protein